MKVAINTSNLCKTFGNIEAVKNLSFNVPTGCIFGLLGPNGSGKSTTIRMLCGILRPSSGTATVLGLDIVNDAERLKKNIGYMSQKFSLYEDLTVNENMEFFGTVYGLPMEKVKERKTQLSEEMMLIGRGNQLVGTLSGGWKQRLALACAFLHRPRLLILDEPTAGVDPVSRSLFWYILKTLTQKGITILVTTHYMDEAERCDLVALMLSGKLYAFDTPGNLMANTQASSLEEVFINMVNNRNNLK